MRGHRRRRATWPATSRTGGGAPRPGSLAKRLIRQARAADEGGRRRLPRPATDVDQRSSSTSPRRTGSTSARWSATWPAPCTPGRAAPARPARRGPGAGRHRPVRARPVLRDVPERLRAGHRPDGQGPGPAAQPAADLRRLRPADVLPEVRAPAVPGVQGEGAGGRRPRWSTARGRWPGRRAQRPARHGGGPAGRRPAAAARAAARTCARRGNSTKHPVRRPRRTTARGPADVVPDEPEVTAPSRPAGGRDATAGTAAETTAAEAPEERRPRKPQRRRRLHHDDEGESPQ